MSNLLDRRFLGISLSVLAVANQPDDNSSAGTQYIVGDSPAGAFAGAAVNSLARFDGTAWSFTTPKVGELEVLNLQTSEILKFDGAAWSVVYALHKAVAPVLAIVPTGSVLPANTAAGETFINTANAKLFTANAADSWDTGTNIANGTRYASSTDFKIYTSNGESMDGVSILNGDLFLNKENGAAYIFDSSAPAFVKITGLSSYDETVTEVHTLTAAEVTAKGFSLSNSVATGKENNTLLFVSGIAQAVGTDFTVSGNSISWNGNGLDSLGLAAGDTFIAHYVVRA